MVVLVVIVDLVVFNIQGIIGICKDNLIKKSI